MRFSHRGHPSISSDWLEILILDYLHVRCLHAPTTGYLSRHFFRTGVGARWYNNTNLVKHRDSVTIHRAWECCAGHDWGRMGSGNCC